MLPIVLASGSPRRKALLEALGLKLTVVISDVEETFEGASPSEIVVANARLKCQDVAAGIDYPALVIAADTLVFYEQHVLGKPADPQEARNMLRILSGNTHQVVTGVCATDTSNGKLVEGHETTNVTFRKLSDDEIGHFVHAVNPVDRAGAYTVEGPGSLIVESYSGCYQNVLGLPIVRLDKMLRDLGHDLFEMMDADRSVFL